MTESTVNHRRPAKYAKLMRIATLANIFAWIVLIVYILWVVLKFFTGKTNYEAQNFGEHFEFMRLLSENPLYIARYVLDMMSTFLQGVIYALVLRGIALGLNMIVETHLNYVENSQEVSHE